jgi:hypothetical protein
MLVPPCIRRCLTPVDRSAASSPPTEPPESRISIPKFKKATAVTPANAYRLRQERETAKNASSYERGSVVTQRIRAAIGHSNDFFTSETLSPAGTTNSDIVVRQNLKNRTRRGQSIDLSLFPSVTGAVIKRITKQELKFLRSQHVKKEGV